MIAAQKSPGVGVALLGFGLLALGFVSIGFGAQLTSIISGLWITEAFAIAAPALLLLAGLHAPMREYLGLRWPGAKWLALAAATAFFNQPIVSFLTWFAQQVLPTSVVADFDLKNASLEVFFTAHPWTMLAAVALSAPLGEEIFFRGFALPAMTNSMRARWAALLSAVLFSAMHWDAVGALGLFEIGLWLAVLRFGSGSIFPAMLGHALNNAIAGSWFLLGLQTAGHAPPPWAVKLGIDNPDAPPPTWVLGLGAALLIAFAALAWRVLSRPAKNDLQGNQVAEVGPQHGPQRSPSGAWLYVSWALWGLCVIAGFAQTWRIARPH
jgi:membrane protease YdiL (CAAX protease family)